MTIFYGTDGSVFCVSPSHVDVYVGEYPINESHFSFKIKNIFFSSEFKKLEI